MHLRRGTKRNRGNKNNANAAAAAAAAKKAARIQKAIEELGPAAYAVPVNHLKLVKELRRVRELLEHPELNADTRDLLESYKASLEREMTIPNLMGGGRKRTTRRTRRA